MILVTNLNFYLVGIFHVVSIGQRKFSAWNLMFNMISRQAFEPLITQAILQNNKSSNNVLTKAFESHINLDNSYHIKKDAFGDTVTVYLMVLYEEYDFSSNAPI